MRAAFGRRGRWLCSTTLVAAGLGGCKAAPQGSRAPAIDDIDRAEAVLADNERRLAQVGIWVEPASPAADGGADVPLAGSSAGQDDERALAGVSRSEPEPQPESEAVSASASGKSSNARSRCDRVCDLAEVSCDLAQQICELATRHAGELRYHNACARAAAQCRAASEACDVCED